VKRLLLILIVIGIFTIGAGGFLFSKFSKVFVKKEAVNEEPSIGVTIQPTLFEEKEGEVNILLLGYGGSGHDGGTLTDTMIILHINNQDKKAKLISIPRDLWLPIPVDWERTAFNKINAAYAIGLDDKKYPNKKPEFRGEAGGGTLAKYAASVVTGLPIKYFIAVDFGQLTKIIDLLGGVETDVPRAFHDYFYPVKGKELELCGKSAEEVVQINSKYSGFELEKQFTCRYEHLHFDKGQQIMTGETALKFVRSRHSETYGGDFARSERQYALLLGIKNKLLSFEATGKTNVILDKLTQNVRTDMDKNAISSIITFIGNSSEYQIGAIHLTEDNVLKSGTGPAGEFILVPRDGQNNWNGIRNYIQNGLN